MKRVLAVLFVSISINCFAQNNVLFPFYYKRNPLNMILTLSSDPNLIDESAFKNVIYNLGLKTKSGICINGYGKYRFVVIDFKQNETKIGMDDNILITENSYLSLTDEILFERGWTKDSSIYATGINAYTSDSDYNFNLFLLSAYLQEQNNEYKKNDLIFYDLAEKDKKVLFKKTMLLPGSGFSYFRKSNPFNRSSLMEGAFFAYLFDFASLIPLFVGTSYVDSREDKILNSVIGISGMLTTRLISWFYLKAELKRYNVIRDSGYRIPNMIKY